MEKIVNIIHVVQAFAMQNCHGNSVECPLLRQNITCGSVLLTSIICLMHTELLRDFLWCSMVAVSSVTLHASSWLKKKLVVKTWTKSHFNFTMFLLIFLLSFSIWSSAICSYKNNNTTKLNVFAFLSSFCEILTLSPWFSFLFTLSYPAAALGSFINRY